MEGQLLTSIKCTFFHFVLESAEELFFPQKNVPDATVEFGNGHSTKRATSPIMMRTTSCRHTYHSGFLNRQHRVAFDQS